jgi:pimeloyl-ACP methyl ester carboxylesterase
MTFAEIYFMQSESIFYKGARVHFAHKGSGETVVFLHGFLEDSSMWKGIIRYMPKRYRVLCIDLMGHGKSDGLGYIYQMEEMADAVLAVVKHLKIRKVNLVGHSMGGYVALAFGERNPDMVRSLTLLNSTSRADSEAKQADRNRAIALVKQNHKEFTRHAIPMLFSEKARQKPHGAIAKLQKSAAEMSAGSIAAALEGMKIRADREVLLHFAPYPISLIAGKTDSVIPAEQSAEQMEANNTHGIWLNTAHMAPWEIPKKTADAISAFLKMKEK